jgi:S-adenosylmethionine decarboxylase proenzyme
MFSGDLSFDISIFQVLLSSLFLPDSAAKLHCKPDFVSFSRANYKFPHVQPDVHRDFDSEVNYLNKFFDGHAYILGPVNGPRWHLYVADMSSHTVGTRRTCHEQTFEVVMTDLDRSAMLPFYRKANDPEALIYNAKVVTKMTGIDQLLPGAFIDDFLFEPCGYSCNGVRGSEYFTIHITPEPHCSFVSFETNAPMASYNEVLQKVLNIFRPGNFSVSVFVDNESALGNSQLGLDWEYDQFSRDDCCYHEFSSHCNIAYGNFQHQSMNQKSGIVEVVSEAKSMESDQKLSEEDKVSALAESFSAENVQALLAKLGLKEATILPANASLKLDGLQRISSSSAGDDEAVFA